MIVVDSNILAYLYLPSEHTEAAEALLDHAPNGRLRFSGEVSFVTFLRVT